MKKFPLTEEDKSYLEAYKKPEQAPNSNFSGKVINKPWGYEYLMFNTPEVSIWMLYIKKGFSTSLHCHPNKKTSLLVVLGEAKGGTLKEEFILQEKEGVIYDKGVFHTTEALSEKGVFVMEIETPTDKTDLFRIKDRYNRAPQKYTSKNNITEKTYNYHYLSLEDKENSANLGKYNYTIKILNNPEDIKRSLEFDVGILLSGKIEGISPGEIITSKDLGKKPDFPIKVLLIRERKLIKVSDYVMSFLEKKGIKNIALVSGGNLMYLLESLRTHKNINYICNHHEQASAMVAEGYSKLKNEIGVAMVTSGPGGTNAITGVADCWVDSNPLLILSGQSYSTQTIGKSKLRQLGVQEINIVDMVRPITKYAVMVTNPKNIRYHLEKAFHIATTGRPGPVWLDIPINIQMSQVEEKDLLPFNPPKQMKENPEISQKVKEAIEMIKNAERPIILLGNGVRLANAEKEFIELAEKLDIPIVTSRNANDLIWDNHPSYVGRIGSFGQRYANMAIQNSDLLLSVGSRIGLAVTGWAYNDFARAAKKIIVDVDKAELEKPTVKPDLAIQSDAKEFIKEMLKQCENYSKKDISKWKEKISHWKEKYPIVLPEYKLEKDVNTYYFTELLSEELNEKDIVVTDVGMSFQCVMQAFKIKRGQRLFSSSGFCAMGCGLPNAIGACLANDKKRVICTTGDGGLMMNIQELETLRDYNLPVKVFIFNNHGYTSIRETQRNYFEGLIGSDNSSGVGMPDFIKVAESFGLKTKRITNQESLRADIKEVLDFDGPVICDLNISENQPVQPKQGSFNRPDGKTVPRPIEDMFPYIDREEFEKEMIIEPIPFDPYKGEK